MENPVDDVVSATGARCLWCMFGGLSVSLYIILSSTPPLPLPRQSLQLDDLDITTEQVDLSEIGADLDRFREHELVKAALSEVSLSSTYIHSLILSLSLIS